MSNKSMESNASNQARVLVVLPTLGQRTDLLAKTLASIKAQSPTAYDIVMIFPIDNKPTMALAREYGAVVVDDPGGISAAVNAGIAQAKPQHEYISWIGDDDLVTPGAFSAAITMLDESPESVVAYGYCDYIDDKGNKLFTSRAGSLAPWLMTWGPNLIPCPGAMFRTSALYEAGGFDVNNRYSMDLDMLLRLRKLGKFINTRRVQASFRWHPSSTTVANRSRVVRETEAVKRKYLPKPLRPFSLLWDYPVRLATVLAARRVNAIASKSSNNS